MFIGGEGDNYAAADSPTELTPVKSQTSSVNVFKGNLTVT